MAILVKEEAQLTDRSETVTDFLVIAHDYQGSNRKTNITVITPQVHAYASFSAFQKGIGNYLRIEGFPEQFTFVYEYMVDMLNMYYWFDVKLKEFLLKTFPNWKEENLIITTTPSE